MKMTQFRQMIREIIDEELNVESTAGEEAKRIGLERKPGFGNYGPPGKDLVTHVSRGGKLEPIAEPKTPVTQREKNKPQDTLKDPSINQIGDTGGKWEKMFGDLEKMRSQSTPMHRKVMDKIGTKLDKVDWKSHYGKTVSPEEFEKITKVPQQAMKYYDKYALSGKLAPSKKYSFKDDGSIRIHGTQVGVHKQ